VRWSSVRLSPSAREQLQERSTGAFYASCPAVVGCTCPHHLAGGARRIERCWTEPLVGDPTLASYGLSILAPGLLGCVLPLPEPFRKPFFRPPSGPLRHIPSRSAVAGPRGRHRRAPRTAPPHPGLTRCRLPPPVGKPTTC